MLRGTYQGIQRIAGVRAGAGAVDYVYNSMPPVPGQVYPRAKLRAVTEF